jgi:hypothetical protein
MMSDNEKEKEKTTTPPDEPGINDVRRKYACLRLDTADDLKEMIGEVIKEIWADGTQVENAGRICNLSQVWLKATELTKLDEIEERLKALETGKECKTKEKKEEST